MNIRFIVQLIHIHKRTGFAIKKLYSCIQRLSIICICHTLNIKKEFLLNFHQFCFFSRGGIPIRFSEEATLTLASSCRHSNRELSLNCFSEGRNILPGNSSSQWLPVPIRCTQTRNINYIGSRFPILFLNLVICQNQLIFKHLSPGFIFI